MEIISKIESRMSKLSVNYVFSINELFTGIEWKSFAISDRSLAGRIFYQRFKKGKYPNISDEGTTATNKRLYKVIKEF
ncbi:DUF1413 domain-containing protein [Liquorilactobacillus hordei]|uniref:DUF1413 domain-containing protein n=1 Tax=Liquorilactobacillus hordei TaxID=468911 RepID=UPI0039EB3F89